jgi:hypothetical protein
MAYGIPDKSGSHLAGHFSPPASGYSGVTVSLPGGGVRVRPAKESDMGLIVNTWTMSQLRQRRHQEDVKHEVRVWLDKPKAIIVACHPQDVDQLFGFAVGDRDTEGAIVRFIAVKQAFQKMGIGSMLLQKLLPLINWDEMGTIRCSTWSPACDALCERYNLEYDGNTYEEADASPTNGA